ncbi:MAG: hypothetical protein M0Z42_14965 [Actinomycetota bacterium]|nr:hypothetical protein [Actinomycetota bacterium]
MSSPLADQQDEPPRQPRALRLGLPYGAVMATGGAGQLAGTCGLAGAARPLLWLAVAEAGWIAGRGLIRHRGELRLPPSAWARIGPPAEHAGVLTVPVGLAVVATGLSTQPGPAKALGAALVVLAWLSAAVLVARFGVSVTRRGGTMAVDGGWFLAPAAVLGAGIAAAAYAGQAVGLLAGLLRWVALVAAAVGVAGYWAVVAGGALAVARRGLGHERRGLWWIAAGCGGLAAAAVGRVLAAGRALWPSYVPSAGHVVAGATWSVAAALAVPIVVVGMRSLARSLRVVRAAPWPPTFSTAVFALGTLATAKMLGAPAVTGVGKVAAGVTLALWAVTTALHASRLLPTAPRHGAAGTTDRASSPDRAIHVHREQPARANRRRGGRHHPCPSWRW